MYTLEVRIKKAHGFRRNDEITAQFINKNGKVVSSLRVDDCFSISPERLGATAYMDGKTGLVWLNRMSDNKTETVYNALNVSHKDMQAIKGHVCRAAKKIESELRENWNHPFMEVKRLIFSTTARIIHNLKRNWWATFYTKDFWSITVSTWEGQLHVHAHRQGNNDWYGFVSLHGADAVTFIRNHVVPA